ncbi:hypothetical protein [Fulvivirga lutea]|uniref:Uncharacterized protein n=1 Tax=Fulvivirga lutea TaxID=2810512 RepID=A0A974WFT3_9BACT|nr:hypothetical protein [Fulvivirga lutea]QSE97694.1 hypothetical protein JR347_00990 [Fulvivirga lutea]
MNNQRRTYSILRIALSVLFLATFGVFTASGHVAPQPSQISIEQVDSSNKNSSGQSAVSVFAPYFSEISRTLDVQFYINYLISYNHHLVVKFTTELNKRYRFNTIAHFRQLNRFHINSEDPFIS